MSTYKVIQDIEAEDKLVGPLTLRQFIYAGICCLCLYLSFLSFTKGVGFMAAIFVPIAGFTGFFAFPFGRDQPTEVWALAKVRFMLKPRKRIWDQDGVKELVTVTAPKHIEQSRTNGLSEWEVQSRLHALADTIDSRGWAIKNANINLYSGGSTGLAASDRLVAPVAMPQEVSNIDIKASDDILDEANNPIARNLETMLDANETNRRQALIAQLQAPEAAVPAPPIPIAPQIPPQDYYFMHQPAAVPGQAVFQNAAVVPPGADQVPYGPQAAVPTAEEQALVEKFKQENASQQIAYGHLKTLLPLSEQAAQPAPAPKAAPITEEPPKPDVTPEEQAAKINLANRDDLDVATIQRMADQAADEVVISLH